MSWFNNSLHTLKGQITTFAQEVLAEADKDDEEINPFETLEECKKQNNELMLRCSAKDTEVGYFKN